MMVLHNYHPIVSGADRHLDITFGLQVVESSSLVSVLFRGAFSHPYISFFHLLVNGFSVTCKHSFDLVCSEIFTSILESFFLFSYSVCTLPTMRGPQISRLCRNLYVTLIVHDFMPCTT